MYILFPTGSLPPFLRAITPDQFVGPTHRPAHRFQDRGLHKKQCRAELSGQSGTAAWKFYAADRIRESTPTGEADATPDKGPGSHRLPLSLQARGQMVVYRYRCPCRHRHTHAHSNEFNTTSKNVPSCARPECQPQKRRTKWCTNVTGNISTPTRDRHLEYAESPRLPTGSQRLGRRGVHRIRPTSPSFATVATTSRTPGFA